MRGDSVKKKRQHCLRAQQVPFSPHKVILLARSAGPALVYDTGSDCPQFWVLLESSWIM